MAELAPTTRRRVSSLEAAKEAGITYRQLDYWVGQRLIEGQSFQGSGTQRDWTPKQIERLKEIREAIEKAIVILEAANLPSHAQFLRGGRRVHG